MADVFISYARLDQGIVEPIVERMRTEHFTIWWDRRLVGGQRWDLEIEKELSEARCVLTIWTPASIDREWVHIEAHAGHRNGILIPVLIGCKNAPLAFSLLQSIDLTAGNERAYASLVDAVRKKLKNETVRENYRHELSVKTLMIEPQQEGSLRAYISHQKRLLDLDPKNSGGLLGMGIAYTQLGLFDISSRFLNQLIQFHPEMADAYLYAAICLFKGRRPRSSNLDQIRNAEAMIETAINLDIEDGKHSIALAALRFDYYITHGMRIRGDRPQELMNTSANKHIDRLEICRLLEMMGICDGPILSTFNH